MGGREDSQNEIGSIVFGSFLMAIIAASFLTFMLLGIFAPQALAHRLGGGPTSVGIAFGLGLVAEAIITTAIYVLATEFNAAKRAAYHVSGRGAPEGAI